MPEGQEARREVPAATAPDAAWVNGYLAHLGAGRQPPSLAYLRALTRAHVLRVQFENISSIVRRLRVPQGEAVLWIDPYAKLSDWRAGRGGGVCFEAAEMFSTLLCGLGFDAHPVLAMITFVGSHQAVIVELDGARYLLDVGNGAPFFEPIAVSGHAHPLEVSECGLGWRFSPHPDGSDRWIQDRSIDGVWQPFCTYDLSVPTESERMAAYQRHHVRGQSWVVDDVRLIRCTESTVWTLYQGRLAQISRSGKSITAVETLDAYRQVVAEVFALPNAPIEQALNATSAPF